MRAELVLLSCKTCGASLEIEREDLPNYLRCQRCGNLYRFEKDVTELTDELLLKRGIKHLELGSYARAAKMFDVFVDNCPEDYRGYLGLYLSNYSLGKVEPTNKRNALRLAPESIRSYLGNLEIRDLIQEKNCLDRLNYLNETSSSECLKNRYEQEYIELVNKQKNREDDILTEIANEKAELRTYKRKSHLYELGSLIKNIFLGLWSAIKKTLIFAAITIVPYIVVFAVVTGNSGVNEYWNKHWIDPFFIACLVVLALSGMVTFIKKQYEINSKIKAKIRTNEAKIDDSYATLKSIKTLLPKQIDELNSKYERLQSVYKQNRINNATEIRRLEQQIALSQSQNNIEYYYPLLC